MPISNTLSNATQQHSNGIFDVLIRGRKSSARALNTQCQPMDETLVSTSRTYRATQANKRQLSKTMKIEVAGTVQPTTCKPRTFRGYGCIPESPATELALIFHAEKMSVKRFRLINNAEKTMLIESVCWRRTRRHTKKNRSDNKKNILHGVNSRRYGFEKISRCR